VTALALAGAGQEAVVLLPPPELPRPRPPNPPGRPPAGLPRTRELDGVDVTPCARCGLRGHVAGDPDRCLFYRGSFGLGGQGAAAERAALGHDGSAVGRRR
jgi:hypothetical protein